MLIRELVQQYNALSIDYQDAVLKLNQRAMKLMPFKPGETSDGDVVEACENFLVARERFYAFGVERVVKEPEAAPVLTQTVYERENS